MYSIPPGLVTCLPAQAVPCTLAGNYGTQSENLIQPFLSLVKDNVFRIKVKKIFLKKLKQLKSTILTERTLIFRDKFTPAATNYNVHLEMMISTLELF